MMPVLLVAAALSSPLPLVPQVEKQVVVSITAPDLDGGILSEITWDGGLLLLQGVVVNSDGTMSGRYVVLPSEGVELKHLKEQSEASAKYWTRKSQRLSPTGMGRITNGDDASLPMYGIGSLEQRINQSVQMGGMRERTQVLLGRLVLHERHQQEPPYDGEVWGWSPPELNRIAYVDGKGDLWVASADGSRAQRLLKGDFTLPAWSEDGASIAVAERKDKGRRWDITLVHLPEALRTPPR
jgi:hypothetical protein